MAANDGFGLVAKAVNKSELTTPGLPVEAGQVEDDEDGLQRQNKTSGNNLITL